MKVVWKSEEEGESCNNTQVDNRGESEDEHIGNEKMRREMVSEHTSRLGC